MKDKYSIGLANLVNGAMLGYKDTSNVSEYKQWIENYVNHSEQEIQGLKEVIKDLRKAIGRKEETIFELEHERVPYTNTYVDALEENIEAYKKMYDNIFEKYKKLNRNVIQATIDLETIIEIIEEQPTGDDKYILDRLNANINIFGGED